MAEYWWCHAVPARLALDAGADKAAVRARYAPARVHPYAPALRQLSEGMLRAAPQRYFTGGPPRRARPARRGGACGVCDL
jgi:hypothetical protein